MFYENPYYAKGYQDGLISKPRKDAGTMLKEGYDWDFWQAYNNGYKDGKRALARSAYHQTSLFESLSVGAESSPNEA